MLDMLEYKDALKTSNIVEDVLPNRTKRMIAKHTHLLEIEADKLTDDQKTEIKDLNSFIIDDIALYMAEQKEIELKQNPPTPPDPDPTPQTKKTGNWWTSW